MVPQKDPPVAHNRGSLHRLIMWIAGGLLSVGILLVGWQLYVEHLFADAVDRLQSHVQRRNASSEKISLNALEPTLRANQRSGPVDQPGAKVFLLKWRGPLRTSYMRLFVDKDANLVNFDTQPRLPDPVPAAIQEPLPNSETTVAEEQSAPQPDEKSIAATATGPIPENLEQIYGPFEEAKAKAEHEAAERLRIREEGRRIRAATSRISRETQQARLKAEFEKIPLPPVPSPKADALEKIRRQNKDIEAFDMAKVDSPMLQAKFEFRRRAWYNALYLNSLEKHGTAIAKSMDATQAFVKKFVEVAIDQFPSEKTAALAVDAEKLLLTKIDDPLVLACALQLTKNSDFEYDDLRLRILALFAKSTYPVKVAYFALAPWVSAEDLSALQAARGDSESEADRFPFYFEDPVELRIAYEAIVSSISRDHVRERIPFARVRAVMASLLSQPRRHPWLESMLIGKYTELDGFDMQIKMEVLDISDPTEAAERSYPPSDPTKVKKARDLPHVRGAERKMDLAMNAYLNAWYHMPENPEAAANLLRLIKSQILNRVQWSIRVNDQIDYYVTKVTSFAGESPEFWLAATLNAQFDYAPVYRDYLELLRKHDVDEYLVFTNKCLNSGRFDTNVPEYYLYRMELAEPERYFDSSQADTVEFVRVSLDGLRRLEAGYREAKRGEAERERLLSYLCCFEYLVGDIDRAAAVLEKLGPSADPKIFEYCKVTAAEVRRASKVNKRDQPFSIGWLNAIKQLEIAADDHMIICRDRKGVLHRMDLKDGSIVASSDEIRPFDHFSLSRDGDRLLAWKEHEYVQILDARTFRVIQANNSGALEMPVTNADGIWYTQAPVSPDGIVLVPGSRSHFLSIALRDTDGAKTGGHLKIDGDEAVQCAHSADGSRIGFITRAGQNVQGDARYVAAVVRTEDSETLKRLVPFSLTCEHIALNNNGKFFAVAGYDYDWGRLRSGRLDRSAFKCYIFDTETGQVRFDLQHLAQVNALAFVEGERWLATAAGDNSVRLWNPSNGELEFVLLGHNRPVLSMDYDARLRLLITGDAEGRICIWHLDTMELDPRNRPSLQEYVQPNQVRFVVHPQTGDMLTKNNTASIVWNRADGYRSVQILPPGVEVPLAKGDWLSVTAKRDQSANGPMPVFEIISKRWNDGKEYPPMRIESPDRPYVTLHEDREIMFMAGPSKLAWDLNTAQPLAWSDFLGENFSVYRLAYAAKNQRLAVAATKKNDAEVIVVTVPNEAARNAAVKDSVTLKRTNRYEPQTFAFDDTGERLLLADGAKVTEIFDARTGAKVTELPGGQAGFSPSGKLLFAAGPGYDIKIYETEQFKLVSQQPILGGMPTQIQWGDDSTLYFWLAGSVQCYDLESQTFEAIDKKSFPMPRALPKPDSLLIPAEKLRERYEQQLRAPLASILKELNVETANPPLSYDELCRTVAQEFPEIKVTYGNDPVKWNHLELPNRHGQGFFGLRFRSDVAVPADMVVLLNCEIAIPSFELTGLHGRMDRKSAFGIQKKLELEGVQLSESGDTLILNTLHGAILPGREHLISFTAATEKPVKVSIAIRIAEPSARTNVADPQNVLSFLGVKPLSQLNMQYHLSN